LQLGKWNMTRGWKLSKFQSRVAILTKIIPNGISQLKIKISLQLLNGWRWTKNVNEPLTGNRGREIERWRHFRSQTPTSGRVPNFTKYTKTITNRRKVSMDHSQEIGIRESNGDVISGLRFLLSVKWILRGNWNCRWAICVQETMRYSCGSGSEQFEANIMFYYHCRKTAK
jgi:hypothetical protein